MSVSVSEFGVRISRCELGCGGERWEMKCFRWKWRWIAGWVLLGLTGCGPSGGTAEGSKSLSVQESEGAPRGSVWVVEGGQGGRLFLCGTIHLLREQDYPLAKVYDLAYEQSRELILELPPGSSEGGELGVRMAELGRLPDGARLEQGIDAAEWKRVQAWAAKRGVDKAVLNGCRPWYVSLILVAMEYGYLGASPERGVEQVFEDRAKQDGKPGQGLETVDFQLQLFAGMTAEQEQQILTQTLDELETVEAEFDQMIRFWKEGNMDELQALLMREAQQYPDLMDAFLVARNRAWLPTLEAKLESGSQVMVLVGAGHLGGDEGLITLLKGKGYRVQHASDWFDSGGGN